MSKFYSLLQQKLPDKVIIKRNSEPGLAKNKEFGEESPATKKRNQDAVESEKNLSKKRKEIQTLFKEAEEEQDEQEEKLLGQETQGNGENSWSKRKNGHRTKGSSSNVFFKAGDKIDENENVIQHYKELYIPAKKDDESDEEIEEEDEITRENSISKSKKEVGPISFAIKFFIFHFSFFFFFCFSKNQGIEKSENLGSRRR